MGKSEKQFGWPGLIAILGLIAAGATFLLALAPLSAWATAIGAAAAAFAIALTYIIARRQGQESATLATVVAKVDGTVSGTQDAVRDVNELLQTSTSLIRQLAERDSAQEYEPESVDDEPSQELARPSYEADAIAMLKTRGADLDFNRLEWKPKLPDPPLPGNHGWFVESPGGTARWFVRRARGMTVRKAMPRDFLDRLEAEQRVNPRTIALDFQLKQHGLAAWYARTYSGELYKVSRSNGVAGQPIRTERIEEDAQ